MKNETLSLFLNACGFLIAAAFGTFFLECFRLSIDADMYFVLDYAIVAFEGLAAFFLVPHNFGKTK
ncbi:hypothetical protein AHIS1_p009 [Acaryochloris phage A-HIS1]|nr:hypothetical protein AHIS1_p009 [Acaryochloris phage A-HIS1]